MQFFRNPRIEARNYRVGKSGCFRVVLFERRGRSARHIAQEGAPFGRGAENQNEKCPRRRRSLQI